MKKMLIDDREPEETRVVILDGNKVEDVEFESSSKKQIKGNIFTAKVIRIEPSLQAAFVDYGGNRHGFLAFGEIHPDYYNISDEIKAEIETEVDEIIERKRKYQAERKAEQERRRLEREQKRAEYEAKRLAEEQAAACACETTENTVSEAVDEPTDEVQKTAEAPVCHCKETGVCTCGDNCQCGDDCPCHNQENTEQTTEAPVCHCKETGVCTCGDNCQCGDDCPCHNQENTEQTTEAPVCHCKETGVCTCGDNCQCGDDCPCHNQENTEQTTENAEETSEEVSEEASEETATAEESTEENTENKQHRTHHRRSARFLGGRRSNKKYKVSAEAAGLMDESVAEDLSSEDMEIDTAKEKREENFDDDEKTCREFDNDEEDNDFEHYLEIQRKLIFSRKLYYRSTIQDVIKEGQTLLIQIVKEERGNKGAACTTYLSLAGRYCVLMPNRIKSGGVSRKITSSADRKRLKEIMHELPINDTMSMIIRTAGEDKPREDIVRDYNYLIRTWNHIRHSALSTQPPALIYEEGDLIKRALRDMYTKDIGEVIIDGDEAYKNAKDFAKILSPNLSRKIKCRKPNEKPLFQQYQIEKELDKLHSPIVQLPSGGYLVINPTEALVSIDVNSGRATHEMDIEETALKTNLEAADEIAKQLRMRNLAGLIVVDFIDMDEAANNHAVEKRMKEAMKFDRSRVQIAKMSIFGLLEISRQRMHSSFVESNYITCPYCKGQGVLRTSESSAGLVLRAIEEEGIKGVNNHLEIKLPADTAIYLLNHKRRNLADLEEKYDLEIIISTDLNIRNINDYKIEKSHIAKNKPSAVAATTTYARANAGNDNEDYEDDEEETEIAEETTIEKETDRSSRRYNRFDRRKGRNRRKSHYNREDKSSSANETPAPQTTAEPEKKKTWWKKLLG